MGQLTFLSVKESFRVDVSGIFAVAYWCHWRDQQVLELFENQHKYVDDTGSFELGEVKFC